MGEVMIGIEAYGQYIPWWRLDLAALGIGRGERAIANFDEDTLTMGVAAGANCLGNSDRDRIDGLYFATTTSPYKEKQISVLAAAALDLPRNIITADFCTSLRAGTTALHHAVLAVRSGAATRVLVIASDLRLPTPGSEFETLFGNGAAAFLVSAENVAVEYGDHYSVADEIHDLWRSDEDRYVRSWEARFTRDAGYLRVLPSAIAAFLQKSGLPIAEITKVAFYAPNAGDHRAVVKKLGLEPRQVQDPLFDRVGDTGAAFSLMQFAGALESARQGDHLLLAGYGSGADVSHWVTVRPCPAHPGSGVLLGTKKLQKDYRRYLRWRGMVEMVSGRRRPPTPTPSASALWRETDQNLRLRGLRCLRCGTVQYPPQDICYKCHGKDNFQTYPLSRKKATVVTYTVDYMSPSPDPPAVVAVLNVDGGGRMFLTMADKEADEVQIGMRVGFSFRKLASIEGIQNYFWKCIPDRIPAQD
jgi:hydroxymethylglutaryl-CoA synthase